MSTKTVIRKYHLDILITVDTLCSSGVEIKVGELKKC